MNLQSLNKNHYERLKKIIESQTKGVELEKFSNIKNIPTINSEIKGEFEPNKDEIVTVINLAINSEKKAQERYRKIANMFEDEESKQIFIDLSLEERNHQRILEDEIYQLSNKGTIIWE
jgi:hypothetical protein